MPILSKADLALQFGTEEKFIPTGPPLEYATMTAEEEFEVITALQAEIESFEKLDTSGNKDHWEGVWSERLDAFVRAGTDDEAVAELFPQYLRTPGTLMRLTGHYVRTPPTFEAAWYAIFMKWLLAQFEPFKHIVEFGCGSGINVALLSLMFPLKRVTGCDWTEASVRLVDAIHTRFHTFGEALQVDFFDPPEIFPPLGEAAVLTVGALEQTGDRWEPFLEWLLARKPALVVHVEPQLEFTGPGAFDQLMRNFMRYRKYWRGYVQKLQKLKEDGKIEILKAHRTGVGSKFIEGYSQVVWRPR